MEMVNAKLVKAIVVDDYLAEYWKQVFPDIVLNTGAAVRTGGELGIAIRKNSPKLKAELDAIVKKFGPKTMFGNMITKRYLVSTKYTKSATSDAEIKRFRELVALFQKYAGQYQLDWVLMAAQGFQESGLDHSVRSPVGAIGVMQVMPKTGAELKVGDVKQLDANVHAGVKYMRFMIDQYYKDEPMDQLNKGLFTFASYNAGPARIRQMRRLTAERGLDPNIWFNNVEQVVSEKIGRETVTYVSNIYKYYVAYRLALEEMEQRKAAGVK